MCPKKLQLGISDISFVLLVLIQLAQLHDALGMRIRERPQQDSVDHAEDGGVCADAKRQRDDRNRREARTPAELP